ncbi:zinc-binding alcohol dehydrogenase family protein [Phaeobacter sp. J2-8]|uniref:zinc-binding alcohol dehydrogenase family protein n=1 Tax=Phaeobacter sp. J2-8 TaxID=2931394 RepID=UPI001FD472DA|nr:zinc-binding alcohol dehydrogenase family protein [Phaeobacter sp. J2-8]MCJ7873365.1 zinc-binding alcohol dehydrogenase family protein [Phaeobacter sp. J2-8]
MKALRIDEIGKTSLCQVEAQPVGEGQVRVQLTHVGLCGSDLNTFRGRNPLVEFPRIPGHEAVGTIVETGAGVSMKPGTPVVLWPYSACGACSSCRKQRGYACRNNQTLGVQRDGALREDIVLPADAVIANDSLPLHQMVLVEPLSVGFHAAGRGSVKAGDRVVVLGCGMIGLGAVMAAAQAGATVIAVDPISEKEQMARDCGADVFLSETGDALLDAVSTATDGEGADVVIEAVGLPQTFTAAIDLAAFCGTVVYVGYSKAPVTYETKLFNLKELDILGSRNATRQDFDAVMAALETRGDVADRLVTRQIPLSEAATALPYWDANPQDVLKLVVTL